MKNITYKNNFLQFFTIPKESQIKNQLDQFLIHSPFHKHYQLHGYDGLKNINLPFDEEQQKKHFNYHRVRELFSFAGDCIPDMKNGHQYKNSVLHGYFTIDRCITLTTLEGKIIGAVYFRINLILRRSLIANIAVDTTHQRKKLGSFLWNSATLISILYGCDVVSANFEDLGLRNFYQKCGCQISSSLTLVGYIAMLDLRKLEAKNSFFSMAKTISTFNLETLFAAWSGENFSAPESNLFLDFLILNSSILDSLNKDLIGFLNETEINFTPESPKNVLLTQYNNKTLLNPSLSKSICYKISAFPKKNLLTINPEKNQP